MEDSVQPHLRTRTASYSVVTHYCDYFEQIGRRTSRASTSCDGNDAIFCARWAHQLCKIYPTMYRHMVEGGFLVRTTEIRVVNCAPADQACFP